MTDTREIVVELGRDGPTEAPPPEVSWDAELRAVTLDGPDDLTLRVVGTGDGNAVRKGHGHGDAVRKGAGSGDAVRKEVSANAAYVGIDVAFAKNKPLPVCICVQEDKRLVPLPLKRHDLLPPGGRGNATALAPTIVDKFAKDVRSYIEGVAEVEAVSIARIAIDAPSECRVEGQPRRLAELAMDHAGIKCFTTPSCRQFAEIGRKVGAHLAAKKPESQMPHANQLWMLVGFALFGELANVAECIEVYPHAIAHEIGAGGNRKSEASGLRAQLEAASMWTGWPGTKKDEPSFDEICFGRADDRLDAYLSAWVASLDEADRKAFGEPPRDAIWVPRISK